MMSVATNHIKNCGLSNCGDRAFLDTLGNLQRVGIEYVGAGMNLAEGMKPIVLEIKGVKFAFISLGEIERLAFASETTPGIAYLTDETLQDAIAAAKQVGDVVVVMPHWGPEYSPIPNPFQRRYAQIAVDAGADLVIGNHTHVIQGYHMIGEIPVYYGLGNFVFDQTWSEETAQGLMVRITFSGTKITGQQVIPVTIEKNGRVNLADIPTAQRILDRIQKVNDGLK
jgi:poly-gamma-glutamate synthesis protein (capsule biosynthesis protein)